MMRERGYVVISIRALAVAKYEPGDTTPFFAGVRLQSGGELLLESRTDHEDYAAQAMALFGSTEPADAPSEGAVYWRCTLVEVAHG